MHMYIHKNYHVLPPYVLAYGEWTDGQTCRMADNTNKKRMTKNKVNDLFPASQMSNILQCQTAVKQLSKYVEIT